MFPPDADLFTYILFLIAFAAPKYEIWGGAFGGLFSKGTLLLLFLLFCISAQGLRLLRALRGGTG